MNVASGVHLEKKLWLGYQNVHRQITYQPKVSNLDFAVLVQNVGCNAVLIIVNGNKKTQQIIHATTKTTLFNSLQERLTYLASDRSG